MPLLLVLFVCVLGAQLAFVRAPVTPDARVERLEEVDLLELRGAVERIAVDVAGVGGLRGLAVLDDQ